MRKLTIQLPMTSASYTVAPTLYPNMLDALHPLFSCCFDGLRLHFHAPNITPPEFLENDLRHILRYIAVTIEDVNSLRISSDRRREFAVRLGRPLDRANCKGFVVCRDSRPTSEQGADDSSIEFKGKKCSTKTSRGIGYWNNEVRSFWALENKSRSLVEMSMANSWRWVELRVMAEILHPKKTWGVTRMGFEGHLVLDGRTYTDKEEDD
jgi:hypothetical protein